MITAYANVWQDVCSGKQFIGKPLCKTHKIATERTLIDQERYKRIGILHIHFKKDIEILTY